MIDRVLFWIQNHPYKSLGITILFLLCYQSLNIFFGVEPLDPGYYLTAYDNIFDAPECISDTFGQYLTNILGGCIIKLFPSVGVVGFRFIGTLLILLSVVFVFSAFKHEIKVHHILLGTSLVVICYVKVSNGNTFNNGILSCFLYVCAITTLFKGVISNNFLLLLCSGLIIGINIFVRIPNLLGLLLCVVVLFSDIILGEGRNLRWRDTLMFLIGSLIGVSCVIAIIHLLEHGHIFQQSLFDLSHMASSSNSSHNIPILIISQLYTYYNGIVSLCLFFGIFYIMKWVDDKKLIKWILVVFATFLLFYHVYLNPTSDNTWALSVAGCLLLLPEYKGTLSLIAILGLFMLLVEPIGSNSGYGQASLPAFIAAPLATSAVIKRDNIYYVLVACFAVFMKVIKQGNFNEFGPLYEKKYKIECPECTYLYTTQDRAEVLNKSLPDLKKYVHEKDTLLVWSSVPILNYLTHTRPAGGNSVPGYALNYVYRLSKMNYKPKILFHKFSTFGDWRIQTNNLSVGDVPYENSSDSSEMTINQYLAVNDYEVVWENPYFILLFPNQKQN